ncbi:DUF2326 domain-containing protein [Hymenobacter terrenus]|uniref:DUF2326 domain-containing protein n=1 Tax=Hymenobacter terrenus TaxID=1629124 RepID=UPI000619F208|nr:DUF2326 domain-containing protein [Hymenobacter terrenus]
MYLINIFSEPAGLFQPVSFRNGCNFIYGKKDVDNPKESLNSIGKSTFLDLVDFCLLGSIQKSKNPRLDAAKEILSDYKIVLNFRIAGVLYTIKRSVQEPKVVEFGELGYAKEMDFDDVKDILSNLIFARDGYTGVFESKWFRILIAFYVKIQRFKKGIFNDPLKYIAELSELELNVYHLYLLGLDNNLAENTFEVQSELKKIAAAIKQIQKIVSNKYKLKDAAQVSNEIGKLTAQVTRLEKSIDSFKLAEQYKDSEGEANSLTAQIKSILLENVVSSKQLADYASSFEQDTKVSPQRVSKIFAEVSEDLAFKVKKTLEDAIEFRKRLHESRKQFLTEEITRLQKVISSNEEKIKSVEERRARLFTYLSNKNALKDLTESYYLLNDRRQQLADIQANYKLLNEIGSEKSKLEVRLSQVKADYFSFIQKNEQDIQSLYDVFYSVLSSIYVEPDDSASFTLTLDQAKERFLDIQIKLPDMFGKGKNSGRTLIYDLTVATNNILHTKNFPRFLIHDGIFDGVDKAHFISVIEFVNKVVENGREFQYVITINEEGSLEDSFGNKELADPTLIEDQAILVLSPSSKLFGMNFS